MRSSEAYKILGIKPGANEKEIKKAYRKLALKLHPDHNSSSNAESRFLEVSAAYQQLLHADKEEDYADFISRADAADTIQKEKKKAWAQAEKKRQAKREAEEKFRKSELYDLLLLFKYFFHGLILIFSIAAILLPIILAIVIEPVILWATIYFVIIGIFLLWYIIERRKSWFKLGKFNTTKEKLLHVFRMPEPKLSNDNCCFVPRQKASGKSYNIDLIKILDTKVISYGAMDHKAKYNRKAKKVILPRSIKAQYWHRVSSYIKISAILCFLVFFPISSLIWRSIFGIICGGIISIITLKIAGVKPKTTYLFTPVLIVKSLVWIGSLLSISYFGPGFDISLSGYVYLVLAGLFLILDMVFDLIFGLFPFYSKMQTPIIAQRKLLTSLYKEGYQNFNEFPVYSFFYPLMKWLF